MRRNLLAKALALCAVVATGCSGSGSKTGSGSAAGTSGVSYDLSVAKPAYGLIQSGEATPVIDCGITGNPVADHPTCAVKSIPVGTSTVLTATPLDGYRFKEWAGDCAGTANTCALPGGNTTQPWFRVTAVFEALGNGAPVAEAAPIGRVYGYVKNAAGTGLGGLTVSLMQGSTTLDSFVTYSAPTSHPGNSVTAGRYAMDALPGAYTLVVTDATGKNVGQASVTVGDARQGGCTIDPNMVTVVNGGEGVNGCLVQQDFSVTPNVSLYVPPFAVAAAANGKSKLYQAGLNAPVPLACAVSGATFGSVESYAWKQTAGPTLVDTAAWKQNPSFTTPTLSAIAAVTKQADTTQSVSYTTAAGPVTVSCPKYDGVYQGTQGAGNQLTKVGCGVADLYLLDRPSVLTVGRQMFNELSYAFSCTGTRKAVLGSTSSDFTSVVKAGTTSSVVTVATVNPHGLSSGEKVAVAVYKGDVSGQGGDTGFKAGTFAIQVVDANTFTYDDKLANGSGKDWSPLAGYSISVSVTASAQLWPLNMMDGSSANGVVIAAGGTSATVQGQKAVVPMGSLVVLNDAFSSGNAWSVVQPDATAVAPDNAADRNPSFKATQQGVYTVLKNGSTALTVVSSKWSGSIPTAFQADPANYNAANGLYTCYGCHANGEGGAAAQQPAFDWIKSRHAQIVNNAIGATDYNTGCLQCHAAGMDPSGLGNDGFFDLAKTASWDLPDFAFLTDPTTKLFGSNAFPDSLRVRANVTCENCHGPGSAGPAGHFHNVTLESSVCMVCHDGGHHNVGNQWMSEGHADVSVSQGEGIDSSGNSRTCAACHTAQGFAVYAPLAVAGNDSSAIADGFLVGLTTANVSAITCQTCHDPHSLELRVKPADAATLVLWNKSLKLDGTAGAGALCSTCHNSRRTVGLQPDGSLQPATGGATHPGPQTDLYQGKSIFWFYEDPANYAGSVVAAGATTVNVAKLPSLNVHSGPLFQDSCADCHVKLRPAGYPTVGNHTFDAAASCEVCHGSGILPDGTPSKGKAVMDATVQQLQAIDEAMATVVKSAGTTLNVTNAGDPGTTVLASGATAAVDPATLAKIEIGDVHGNLAFKLWFSGNGTEIPNAIAQISKINDSTGVALFSKTRNAFVLQAAWNYTIVEADGSKGIHNMPVIAELLKQTEYKLQVATIQ